MAEQIKPSRWFCRSTSTSKIEGPFDIVELAGLLRSGGITGETLTQAEGDQVWVAFQNRREFDSARNMPADVIYQHLKDEDEEQGSPWSLRRLYYLGWLVIGVMGYGLFGGIRPTWLMHWFQNWVLDALNRIFGH
jgi:hypothetical protein